MLGYKGKFIVEVVRNGRVIDRLEFNNVVTIEGRNHLLKVGVSQEVAAGAWYMGLIGADVTPTENDTAASALGATGTYAELYDYSESDRPQFVNAFGTNAVSNEANPATFTISATVTINVYGVFITSTSTKGDTTGVLLCAGRFSVAKALTSGDVLNVVYTISSV